jgi:hypothetical protein
MITGALSVLSAIDPGNLSQQDLYDFCFGLIQINEEFTSQLEKAFKKKPG